MLNRFLFIALIASFLSSPATNSFAQSAPVFATQRQAAQHCPSDSVVWVNTQTGVYHFAGERYYGRTKQGAFVCQKEADQSGYRPTRNGQ
jgi:hypothetical protein